MHVFRTDLHNLLGLATHSNSTILLSVYNTSLCQMLDRHAPLVTRTLTDRMSASWRTLEIKQAKVQRRLAERKWRESGLTVHRDIYFEQRNLVSNKISTAKKDYLCHKIVSRALPPQQTDDGLIRRYYDSLKHFPWVFLISLMNSLCIRLKRSEAPWPWQTLTMFKSLAQCLKTVVQEVPSKSCDLDPIPTPVLYNCLDGIIPIVTSTMNKSLSSGIVPQCFKHAPDIPLLKKASLDSNCLKHYHPASNLSFLSKVLEHVVLKQFLPSRALPVSVPKASQHWNCFVACSKWVTSGLRQCLRVYFVTAWPVGSLWHNWP